MMRRWHPHPHPPLPWRRCIAMMNPNNITPTAVRRCDRQGYQPLSTDHPTFGLRQGEVRLCTTKVPLLSTEHPLFGSHRILSSPDCFRGAVSVSGFFLAIDANFCAGSSDRMDPNAQLTLRDVSGQKARVRYRCHVQLEHGFKLEALIRVEVGWISPKISFSHVPNVIQVGTGVEVCVPYLFHLAVMSLLDENANHTGSFLYLSGTPMMGFGAGVLRITGGKLVLNPTEAVDPYKQASDFIGHVHYRQVGFLVVKLLGYVVCALACIPASQWMLEYIVPDPLHRHSEDAKP